MTSSSDQVTDYNVTELVLHHTEDLRPTLHYQIVAFVLFTSLFIVGIVGNSLVIFVVSRCAKMKTLTNYYLVSLAVADILVLIGGTLTAIPELFAYTEQWLYGPVLCAIFVFMQYLGINASALSITAFTIERYIGICHPMKAQLFYTLQRVKYIIAGLWSFSLLYNACWLYLAKTVPQTLSNNVTIQTCTFRIDREQYSAIFMVDLVLFYLVPLLLTVVLYTLIGLTLRNSTKRMRKPSQKVDPKTKPTIHRLIVDKPQEMPTDQQMMGNKELVKRVEQARLQVNLSLVAQLVEISKLKSRYTGYSTT